MTLKLLSTFLFTALTLAWSVNEISGAPLTAEDAHGVQRTLNPARGVSVILYSNPAVQDRTREAGLVLHQFLDHPHFQFIVLVDLRGSMADWVRGYTKRRIQRDLEKKFEALPPVPGRAALGPHPQIGAIADFDGKVCEALRWSATAERLRVILFSSGTVAREWEDLQSTEELTSAVRRVLH